MPRTHSFSIELDLRHLQEALSNFFYTLIFHRSLGKCSQDKRGNVVQGAVGYKEVRCVALRTTYLAVASPHLRNTFDHHIRAFAETFRGGGKSAGAITLEFYQLAADGSTRNVWEAWTLNVNIAVASSSERNRQALDDRVTTWSQDCIFDIARLVNRYDYKPEYESLADMKSIFYLAYPDIQPYLFQFEYAAAAAAGGGTFKAGGDTLLERQLAVYINDTTKKNATLTTLAFVKQFLKDTVLPSYFH